MKKLYLIGMLLIIPFLSACTLQKTDTNNLINDTAEILNVDEEGNTSFNQDNLKQAINDIPTSELTAIEKEGILFMVEEEKLAQDVYLFLYDKWNINIFNNISKSESTHIDAVDTLADRYNLTVSSSLTELGIFENDKLQKLYDDLTTQGSISVDNALKVGAAIEEIDILDLEKYIAQTEKEDIKLVYENLLKGSRNHLRAFVKNMGSYVPQYLDTASYNEIVNADIERGGGQGKNKR